MRGFDVEVTYCAESALQLVEQRSFDVIVLDLMMPTMSGFEVAAELRDDPKTAMIPVVVLTAMDLLATDREKLCGRIVAMQQKIHPWPEQLLDTVGRLLRRHGEPEA